MTGATMILAATGLDTFVHTVIKSLALGDRKSVV